MEIEGVQASEKTGIERIMTRWPMLPLLSLSFWISWRFVAFSGTISVGIGSMDYVFYVALLVVCIIAMAFPTFANRFKPHPIIFGAVASVGAVLLLLSGFYGTGLPEGTQQVVGIVGSVLSGIGITCLALRSLTMLGSLPPTEIWISLAYTEFIVVGIYFVVVGTGGPIAALIFMALPLLAGLTLMLVPRNKDLQLEHVTREEVTVPPKIAYVKFGAFIGLLSISCSLALLPSSNDVFELFATNALAWASLGRIVLALFVLAAVVYSSHRFPFSKMCIFVIVMILAILACMSFPSFDPAWPTALMAFVHPVLEYMTLAIAACFIYKTKTRPLFMAALAIGTLYGFVLFGDMIGTAIETYLPDALSGVFVTIVIVCAVDALIFLQDPTYENVMGNVEKPREQVPLGKKRRVSQAQKLKELKGLSDREYDVLLEIQRGQSAQKIAEHMFLSVHTVRGHIQSIYTKCGVHSRDELVDLMSAQEWN